jgi:hypothetical protein
MELEKIASILRNLRVHVVKEEVHIHNDIKVLFDNNNIKYSYEHKLGRGNRIDFLVENGVGVEVKKGKPNRTQVIKQLNRYLEFEDVKEIILVIERSMDIPEEIKGKKCKVIALNKLWF